MNSSFSFTLSSLPTAASVSTYVWTAGLTVNNNTITGGYYDADKVDPYVGGEDCYTCWAAAASNSIAWWQNYYGAYYCVDTAPALTEDDIFATYKRYWKNQGGSTVAGCQWWLAGGADTDNYAWHEDYCHKPDMENGGGYYTRFYNKQNVCDILYEVDMKGDSARSIADAMAGKMEQECVLGIGIAECQGDAIIGMHALSLWGLERDANTGELTAIHVTDSNDLKRCVFTIDVRYNGTRGTYELLNTGYAGYFLWDYLVLEPFQHQDVLNPTKLSFRQSGGKAVFSWSGEYRTGLSYELAYHGENDEYSTFVTSQSRSLSLTLPYDGSYKWWVRVMDGDRALTDWVRGANFSLDLTAPVITLKTPTWSVLGAGSTKVTFAWSTHEAATYALELNGELAWSGSDSSCSFALADGLHKYTLTATDAAGNVRVKNSSFRCDTKAPGKPNTLRAKVQNKGKEAVFTWKSASDISGVRYEFEYKKSSASSYTRYTDTLDSPTLTLKLSGTTTWKWRVRAVDGRGNTSAWVTGTSFSNDLTPPKVTVSAPTPKKIGTRQSSGTLSWSANEKASYVLKINGEEVYRGTGSRYSYTMADGYHRYELTATDAAGNSTVKKGAFRCDTVAPAKPSCLSVKVTKQGEHAALSWKAVSDVSGVSYEVQCKASSSSAYITFDGITEATLTLGFPSTTSWDWRVRAVDGRGNASAWVKGQSFVNEMTPPKVTVKAPSLRKVGTKKTSGTLSWSANEKVTYTLTLNGTEVYSGTGTSYKFTLADGYHRYALTATDMAGNTTIKKGAFRCDTTAPTKPSGLCVRAGAEEGQALLSWAAATDISGVTYDLAIKQLGDAEYAHYQWFEGAELQLSLSPTAAYKWGVRAKDGRGNVTSWVWGNEFRLAGGDGPELDDNFTGGDGPVLDDDFAGGDGPVLDDDFTGGDGPVPSASAATLSLDGELALSAGLTPAAASLGSVAGLSASCSLLPESQVTLSRQRPGTLAAAL